QYVFLREAYGPLPAFLSGWTCFLVIQTGFIAAVGVAFAKFLGVLWPDLGTDHILWQSEKLDIDWKVPVPWAAEGEISFFKRDDIKISAGQFVAVGLTIFLTIVNSFGVELGRWV